MKGKISVLGGGSWGTALALSLAKKGHDIDIWMRDKKQCEDMNYTRENIKYLPGVVIPNNIRATNDLEKAISNKEILISAVPTQSVRDNIKNMKQYINKNQIIVNVSKGIEIGSLCRISEVVKEELPDNEYVVLSGPSHAEEVARDLPTTLVVASDKRKVAEYIQDIFMTPKLRVYTNPDVVGVEMGGALKNIIALGAGISDGLGYGDNTKSALMTRGITEIGRLGCKMGAREVTFAGLSGIGDLIVTCTSIHSRNRRAGILIGEGKNLDEVSTTIGMVVEGTKTTKAAYELSKKYNVEMPITQEIYNVLYSGSDVKNSVVNLMMRNKKYEMEDVYKGIEIDW
ncbi:glycerol-3-phosphate dehydrogenase [NAD(P)+] [Gottschalkia acidurici 9a]|uniref:Glycerol-3-phosphate dehydrogenase [NAD(P)+] n=1 Tax=Gottschalkia acidurici (strain ATCC 7906 / DSM 604 / BCRC 14475 / CIP 104303 / KCTC 5404 / NCIMB 10678 / 9a) TaxID=1128398 RepID=K0B238_GOTA9|nr:NAD(P)H-dependent glycerol-3-phosphate dehydrogenase [Gottschalkia acidurici]AFS78721.1 glycerol-3-phosphate dehydrogenase [NAD(P)+] [Gottschalkia acidurici 9a]